MQEFSIINSLLGGLFIGLSSGLMIILTGRIAGISGILGGLLTLKPGDASWRGLFIIGLIMGGLLFQLLTRNEIAFESHVSTPIIILAGLLVGFGTRLGSGCTSGHGVCGIARFSKRSIIATCIFMSSAMLTLYLSRHVIGIGS